MKGGMQTTGIKIIPPEQKATDLVNSFRMILMNEDTDCGNEILCTSIAIEHATIVADEVLQALDAYSVFEIEYWRTIKKKLEKM